MLDYIYTTVDPAREFWHPAKRHGCQRRVLALESARAGLTADAADD
jgi:hypothetical protein